MLQKTELSNKEIESLKTIDNNIAALGFESADEKAERLKAKADADLFSRFKASSHLNSKNTNEKTALMSKKPPISASYSRYAVKEEAKQNKQLEEIHNFIIDREMGRRSQAKRGGSVYNSALRKGLTTATSHRAIFNSSATVIII